MGTGGGRDAWQKATSWIGLVTPRLSALPKLDDDLPQASNYNPKARKQKKTHWICNISLFKQVTKSRKALFFWGGLIWRLIDCLTSLDDIFGRDSCECPSRPSCRSIGLSGPFLWWWSDGHNQKIRVKTLMMLMPGHRLGDWHVADSAEKRYWEKRQLEVVRPVGWGESNIFRQSLSFKQGMLQIYCIVPPTY